MVTSDKKTICDWAQLKQWLVEVWADFNQTIDHCWQVDKAMDWCRKRHRHLSGLKDRSLTHAATCQC